MRGRHAAKVVDVRQRTTSSLAGGPRWYVTVKSIDGIEHVLRTRDRSNAAVIVEGLKVGDEIDVSVRAGNWIEQLVVVGRVAADQ